MLYRLSQNIICCHSCDHTWEQLSYLEVLESVHRTAEAGCFIGIFLHGFKQPRLDVLRSGSKTADIGSSMVGFQ